jgi:hypothetical protein
MVVLVRGPSVGTSPSQKVGVATHQSSHAVACPAMPSTPRTCTCLPVSRLAFLRSGEESLLESKTDGDTDVLTGGDPSGVDQVAKRRLVAAKLKRQTRLARAAARRARSFDQLLKQVRPRGVVPMI